MIVSTHVYDKPKHGYEHLFEKLKSGWDRYALKGDQESANLTPHPFIAFFILGNRNPSSIGVVFLFLEPGTMKLTILAIGATIPSETVSADSRG